jgi:hypothetical protein
MVPLASLWLPIVLSAVFVFVVSSIIHMFLNWHANDMTAVPREDDVRNALRPLSIPPGEYFVPHAGSMAASKSPEFQEKLKQGPVAMMRVFPNGPFNMGKSLIQWFRPASSPHAYLAVPFCTALAQGSIWLGKKWSRSSPWRTG